MTTQNSDSISPKSLRIIFMGTPDFAVPALEALLASVHRVVAVYSQPPRPAGRGQQLKKSPIHTLAEQHNIPVFTPTSLKTPEAQTEFATLNADVGVVVAYGLLLPQAILDAPKHGCVNIHPSALPRWRGAAPIQRTIMAGDKTTEICIMKMDAGLDTGDVYQRSASIKIADEMNAGALHDQLASDAAPLLLKVLENIASGTATATPQAQEDVTYAQKISKEESRIDWTKSAEEIHNHIRGLAPNMGATCMVNGEILKLFKAVISAEDGKAGSTVDDKLTIACGRGSIQLLEVQKAGKPRMGAEAFLRGQPVAKGVVFH